MFRNRENEAPKIEKKLTEMMGIDNSRRSSAQLHNLNESNAYYKKKDAKNDQDA